MDVSSAGAGLVHEVIGSGAPMLVMHGGLGWDHTCLRPWLDPLASRHRVVFYDHRGNGRSDPHADADTLDHGRWVDDAEALRRALGLGRTIIFETILSLYFYEYRPEIRERLLSQMTCRVAPFNRAFFGGCLAGFDVRDRLGEIGVPTLVLGGGDDWIVPAEHGAHRLAAAIPGATLRIFAKSGHLPCVEEQDEFVDTVHTWWAEAGQGHRG